MICKSHDSYIHNDMTGKEIFYSGFLDELTVVKEWGLCYTEEFVMLYRIICYSVNEVAYNEGLIGRNGGFVISRGDCNYKKSDITSTEDNTIQNLQYQFNNL